MKPVLLTICIFLCFSAPAHARASDDSKFHNMSNIQNQVKDYIRNLPEIDNNKDTKIRVHAIDRRLKLAKCNKLSFNLASGSSLLGKTSVRIICNSPKPWSFYITATISRFEKIYIANGSLSRGHIIRNSDIYKASRDLSKLPFGYVSNEKDIIGKQLKRHVQAGKVLTPSQLTNPLVIKRGDYVLLQSVNKGFSVRMKGVAMMNGAIGDNIRVKNNSSKRIIEGKVTRAGVVTIGN